MESFFVLIISIACLTTGFFIDTSKPESRTAYIAPPLEVKYLTGGFKHQASDSFWLRAVQDMDFCEQKINKTECVGGSWLFKVIDLVVELDDRFKEAYYYGALALTIIISDYKGASVIFDKGTSVFPKSWPLLYAAAYHAAFEEKNHLKASRLYFVAAENGAPAWVKSLAGSMAVKAGDVETAIKILQNMIKIESDPKWIAKLEKKILELRK